MSDEQVSVSDETQAEQPASRWRAVNVPNALCLVRLLGSFAALGLAYSGWLVPFLVLVAFLVFTDWIDGKLAVALKQRTTFGAGLDTVADIALYSAFVLGTAFLRRDFFEREFLWMVPIAATYAVTILLCLVRFRRYPSYHTRLNKMGGFVLSAGLLGFLFAGVGWPLHVAAIYLTVANLETAAITLILPRWQTDLPSIWHAWQKRKAAADEA